MCDLICHSANSAHFYIDIAKACIRCSSVVQMAIHVHLETLLHLSCAICCEPCPSCAPASSHNVTKSLCICGQGFGCTRCSSCAHICFYGDLSGWGISHYQVYYTYRTSLSSGHIQHYALQIHFTLLSVSSAVK